MRFHEGSLISLGNKSGIHRVASLAGNRTRSAPYAASEVSTPPPRSIKLETTATEVEAKKEQGREAKPDEQVKADESKDADFSSFSFRLSHDRTNTLLVSQH